MTTVGLLNNTISLGKRDDYPMFSPLCDTYIVLDYCANQEQWGGIFESGELESMIDKILTNGISCSWGSEFYKMYTYEEDGSTKDWQISWRMYLTSVGSSIYWSQCNTGH